MAAFFFVQMKAVFSLFGPIWIKTFAPGPLGQFFSLILTNDPRRGAGGLPSRLEQWTMPTSGWCRRPREYPVDHPVLRLPEGRHARIIDPFGGPIGPRLSAESDRPLGIARHLQNAGAPWTSQSRQHDELFKSG